MATTSYQDIIITVGETLPGPVGLPSAFSVEVFDSPVGQGEAKERVEVPADLAARLDDLLARRLDADPASQIALGAILADLILPPNARSMFSASLSGLNAGEGLRLRLRLADEVASIPWEFAFWQGMRGERTPSSFLALDTRLSILRELALPFPPDVEQAAPDSRRALVVMASPTGLPPLPGLAAEQAALRAALEAIPGLQAGYLPDFSAPSAPARHVTLHALADDLLLNPRTDIFHFSGHGVFRPQAAAGSEAGAPPAPSVGRLALEDEHGDLAALTADRLCELLRSHGVRLVFLNACQSAARDPHAVWNSLSTAVLKARIPAVVAMQTKIRDDLAAAFSGAFYRALVAGYTLDYAVSVGRMAIRSAAGNDGIDWGVPVLYARSGGGDLFQTILDESARIQAERELARGPGIQVQQNIGQVFGQVIGEFHGNLSELNFFESGASAASLAPSSEHTRSDEGASRATGGPRLICQSCHSDNSPGARFCEICGTALPRACWNCGGVLSHTARFCPKCGKPVEPPNQ